MVLLPPPGLVCDQDSLSTLFAVLAASPKFTTATWQVHDTPDGRLAAAGMALIRHGRRLRLASWRHLGEERTEAEIPWRRRDLPRQVEAWPEGALRTAVAALSAPRAVVPRLSWRVVRAVAQVPAGAGLPPVRVVGWLVAPVGGESRMWVALPDGRARTKSGRALQRRLRAQGWRRATVDPLTALAQPALRAAPAEVEFTAGDIPAGQALRAYLRTACAKLPALEAGVVADIDHEYLHQHRVALRRLRSLTGQFRSVFTAVAGERIRALITGWARCSGRLRDLDVWLAARAEHEAQVPPALRPGLTPLFNTLAEDRAQAQRELAARFGSPDHAAEQAELQRLLAEAEDGPAASMPLATLASQRIWKAYRRVAEQGLLLTADTPAPVVHEARIRCKKLRYLLDACGPLIAAGEVAGLRNQLRAVQAVLGDFNDAAVQTAALLGRMEQAPPSARMLLAVGALVAALERTRGQLVAQVVAGLHGLASSPTRRRYRRCFRRAPRASDGPELSGLPITG